MTDKDPNFTFEELQIESDILPRTGFVLLTKNNDEGMDRLLTTFRHVIRLQLGSDNGEYDLRTGRNIGIFDPDCPYAIWADLKYVLEFLARPCTNGADIYLPSLAHITFSKITFTVDIFILLEDLLGARTEMSPCRLTFRGCQFLKPHNWHGDIPRHCSFPDLEELNKREFEVAHQCFLEEMQDQLGMKERMPITERMFQFDGPNSVKLVGNLRAQVLG
jgi:hypothetical protein